MRDIALLLQACNVTLSLCLSLWSTLLSENFLRMSYIAYFIIATLVTLVTCVRASEPDNSDSIAGPVHCEAGLPVTKASVVLDAEFDVMTPDRRTDLADNLASHLHISVSALRVSALAGRQVSE